MKNTFRTLIFSIALYTLVEFNKTLDTNSISFGNILADRIQITLVSYTSLVIVYILINIYDSGKGVMAELNNNTKKAEDLLESINRAQKVLDNF